MGNKQEELEATVMLESYDLVAITETWCNKSHDRSTETWCNKSTTGVQLLMATGCLEGTGKEGRVEASPSTSRNE